MRLIDADLLGLTDMEIIMCDGDYKEALKMLIDKIEHAPTINIAEPQWIPCSERLPEEGREVLACLTDWRTGEQRRVVSYRIDFNMWHGYGRYNEKCVAWMPLPEPARLENV